MLAIGSGPAWAVKVPTKALLKKPATSKNLAGVFGINALLKTRGNTLNVSAEVVRKTFMLARQNFAKYDLLLQQMHHSVVQVVLPKHTATLGTGFVLKTHGLLWIAMPYHLGGQAGSVRKVRIQTKSGGVKEEEVQIVLSGTAGWHSPDISLAKLPDEWKSEVIALEIAAPDVTKEVYSFGYVAGEYDMEDMLPVVSQLFNIEGSGMLRRFHIPGSTPQVPISGNGYCGSPLLQNTQEGWKVVGMHNGHCMDLDDFDASRGSSVNLQRTVPQLMDSYFQHMSLGRPLSFRGWEIARLDPTERIENVTIVWKDGTEPTVRYLRNFANPYADERAELAVGDLEVQKGDKLIFSILGRTPTNVRIKRQVEFIIP